MNGFLLTILLIIVVAVLGVMIAKPEYVALSYLYITSLFRETTSKDKCEEIRDKHPEWFEPKAGVGSVRWKDRRGVRWSSLHMRNLGMVNDDYSELTEDATESNLYDIGYIWMCGLANSELNRRELYPADWTYGQDGDFFLGGQHKQDSAAEMSRYTALARAFNRGYVDAQTDRNL